MKKYHPVTVLILFAVAIISANNVKAQAIAYLPDHPATGDTITIIYDASKGNGALMNYTGNVYMHTGLLTVHTQSTGAGVNGWTNVVGNWGTADPEVLMESLGNHLYRKTIPIKEFYNILPDQEVLQIGFVFRNTDGTIVGKLGDNFADILESYTHLTGRQPLPPRWSMGYIQSRFGYRDEVQARQIVNDMRSDGFPIDGLVLDLYWFGGVSAMGNLNWDYSMWPTPVDMINDFNELGVYFTTLRICRDVAIFNLSLVG